MAKVSTYTFAAVADDRPGFQLSRPAFGSSGVVRFKSNPSPDLAGVRPSKNVPATLERGRTRQRFGRGSYEYSQLVGAKRVTWASAASLSSMSPWDYYQGGMAWRRARQYGCVDVVPASVYDFAPGMQYWAEVGKLG
jgi:hypothetical protein